MPSRTGFALPDRSGPPEPPRAPGSPGPPDAPNSPDSPDSPNSPNSDGSPAPDAEPSAVAPGPNEGQRLDPSAGTERFWQRPPLSVGPAFLRQLAGAYNKERIGEVAGMLAFNGMLTLFPFLLCLVALMGIFLDPAEATSLVSQLEHIIPREVTTILQERLTALAHTDQFQLLTVGGLISVLSASSGMVALLRALNRAYSVGETRSVWRVRLLALEMTFLSALLTLGAVLAALVTPIVADLLPPPWPKLVYFGRIPVAGLIMLVQAVLVYARMPATPAKHRRVVPGAIVGVSLWLAASLAFSRYLSGLHRYEVVYGAVGGAIVLIVWMWMSAHAVLFGATFNAVLGRREWTEGAVRPKA